ncbi:MAG: hypothetical protein AB8B50_06865, partial [Pirellulaceae bacterium]
LAQGIGSSSLYRYKSLWHPKFEAETQETKPGLCDCPPAGPEGAAGLAHSHKLILRISRNSLPAGDLSGLEMEEMSEESRNSLPAGEFTGLGKEEAIQKTKEVLAEAQLNPPWKTSAVSAGAPMQDSPRVKERYDAFIQQNLDYLVSGDAILAAEALAALRAQLNEAWEPEKQRQYGQLMEEMRQVLARAGRLSSGLIESCRGWLILKNSE